MTPAQLKVYEIVREFVKAGSMNAVGERQILDFKKNTESAEVLFEDEAVLEFIEEVAEAGQRYADSNLKLSYHEHLKTGSRPNGKKLTKEEHELSPEELTENQKIVDDSKAQFKEWVDTKTVKQVFRGSKTDAGDAFLPKTSITEYDVGKSLSRLVSEMERVTNPLSQITRDLERVSRHFSSPFQNMLLANEVQKSITDAHEKMRAMLEPVRSSFSQDLLKMISSPEVQGANKAIQDANRNMESVHMRLAQVSGMQQLLANELRNKKYHDYIRAHQPDYLKLTEDFSDQRQRLFDRLAEANQFSSSILGQLKGNTKIGIKLGFDAAFSQKWYARIESMGAILSSYQADFLNGTDNLLDIDEVIIEQPTITVFNENYLAKTSSLDCAKDDLEEFKPERDRITSSFFEPVREVIEDLAPELLRTWEGAYESIHSTNKDKVRHAISSLRELLSIFLREFATDDAIKEWTEDPNHFHEGKPTQKARVAYMCRSKRLGSLKKIVIANDKTVREMYASLSNVSHTLEQLDDEVLIAVFNNVGSYVSSLMTFAKIAEQD